MIIINIRSGYRSYNIQVQLYNNYVKKDGKAEADRYSARPGFSEHQTGLVLDITTGNTSRPIGTWFDNTPQAKWLYENAYKYGFILRYPHESEYITGFVFEDWHFRFLGIDLATKVYESKLTYDEYIARGMLKEK